LTSFLIAVVLHAIVFVVVQWVFPVEEEEELDYTGPIYVTIEKYKPEIVQSQATPEPAETESAAATSIQTGEARRIVEPSPRTPPVTRKPRPETPATAPVERPEESFLPETAEQTEESFPEGVRRIIIPAEKETLPAGFEREVPRLEQKNEPAAPPEFLSKDEEERHLYFDLSQLDNALVTEGKPGEKGETGRVDDTSSISSEEGASGGTPVITWDEEGTDRILLSPITRPKIPDWVEQEGLRLRTLVVFEVTPEGHTTSLKVERSSGYADVDASVLETVRKLKFNPVTEERIVRGRIDYIITPK